MLPSRLPLPNSRVCVGTSTASSPSSYHDADEEAKGEEEEKQDEDEDDYAAADDDDDDDAVSSGSETCSRILDRTLCGNGHQDEREMELLHHDDVSGDGASDGGDMDNALSNADDWAAAEDREALLPYLSPSKMARFQEDVKRYLVIQQHRLQVRHLGTSWEPPRPVVESHFREQFREELHGRPRLNRWSVLDAVECILRHVRGMGYQKLHWLALGLLPEPAKAKYWTPCEN